MGDIDPEYGGRGCLHGHRLLVVGSGYLAALAFGSNGFGSDDPARGIQVSGGLAVG